MKFIKIAICLLITTNAIYADWVSMMLKATYHRVVGIAVKGDTVIAATGSDGGGIYRTVNNGTVWDSLKNLPDCSLLYWVYLKNINGTIYGCKGGGDLYYTKDLGNTWDTAKVMNKSPIYNMISYGNYLFASTSSSTILRSDDGGLTWKSKNKGFSANASDNYALTVHNGCLYIGGASTKIYKSADYGETWTSVAASGIGKEAKIRALASFKDNLYAVSDYATNKIYKSTDNGETFSEVVPKSLFPTSYGSYTNLLVVGNTLYASDANNGAIIYTSDGVNYSVVKNGGNIVTLVSDDKYLYAGQLNNGVNKIEIPSSSPVLYDRYKNGAKTGLVAIWNKTTKQLRLLNLEKNVSNIELLDMSGKIMFQTTTNETFTINCSTISSKACLLRTSGKTCGSVAKIIIVE
jgi:hypothetical protein